MAFGAHAGAPGGATMGTFAGGPPRNSADMALPMLPVFRSDTRASQVIEGMWYAWQDSNLRPFAPEANALSKLSYRRTKSAG